MPNDYSNDSDRQDGNRNYGSGRDYTYSSARDYRAAGEPGDRDDRNFRGGGTGYGGGYRPDNQGGRENYGSGNRDYYGSDRGSSRSGPDRYGSSQYGSGQNDRGYGQQQYRDTEYRGAYASDGHRFTEGQNDRDRDQTRGDQFRGEGRNQNRDYGRAPQGYDYQDRGFIERAGDEVRSWFGDEEAERRREYDQRHDERQNQGRGDGQGQSWGRASSAASSSYGRDEDYHNWRRGQMDELDRDYHEYRQENAKRFESEFGTWRTNRQTQRTSLTQVKEHMEVVGSDGEHVGTVDKTRDDRIILTKNDSDAGGRHHSIPSSWLKSVDDKVTIGKTAAEAKRHWRDEEGSSAMFGGETRDTDATKTAGTTGSSAASTSFSSSTSTKN